MLFFVLLLPQLSFAAESYSSLLSQIQSILLNYQKVIAAYDSSGLNNASFDSQIRSIGQSLAQIQETLNQQFAGSGAVVTIPSYKYSYSTSGDNAGFAVDTPYVTFSGNTTGGSTGINTPQTGVSPYTYTYTGNVSTGDFGSPAGLGIFSLLYSNSVVDNITVYPSMQGNSTIMASTTGNEEIIANLSRFGGGYLANFKYYENGVLKDSNSYGTNKNEMISSLAIEEYFNSEPRAKSFVEFLVENDDYWLDEYKTFPSSIEYFMATGTHDCFGESRKASFNSGLAMLMEAEGVKYASPLSEITTYYVPVEHFGIDSGDNMTNDRCASYDSDGSPSNGTYTYVTSSYGTSDETSGVDTDTSSLVDDTGSTDSTISTPSTVPGNWTLTLNEEFNGSSLNGSLWSNGLVWDGSFGAAAFTTDNIKVQNGQLVITTKKGTAYDRSGKSYNYSSGLIHSMGKFAQKYGYFEAKITSPTAYGQGFWPAFWLMPDRYPSRGLSNLYGDCRRDTTICNGQGMEIDIMENLTIWGNTKGHYALHWDGYGSDHQSYGKNYSMSNSATHVYGLYWDPGIVIFYTDGQEVGRWENSRVPNVPLFIKLNTAVGGWDGNTPNSSTRFPAETKVDYVRVWQKN